MAKFFRSGYGTFDPAVITVADLVTIHMANATARHAMGQKYRPAIYYYSTEQKQQVVAAIEQLQSSFDHSLITLVLPLHAFRASPPQYCNYYYKNRKKPFCQTYITPKLNLLMQKFSKKTDAEKILRGE